MSDDLMMNDVFCIAPGDLLVVVGGVVVNTTTKHKLAPDFDDLFFVIASWHETPKKWVKSLDTALLLLHLKTRALVRLPSSLETWWLKKL